jgi:hypothetical protein
MKGETIPDQHHIARFCKPTQAPNGQVQATAFMLRPGEESLSVNWLEFLSTSSREAEIEELRNIYSRKLKVGTGARIAALNVGDMRAEVLAESPDRRNLRVLHDPQYGTVNDPSHSGIHGLKPDDELIAELILETVRETYFARR